MIRKLSPRLSSPTASAPTPASSASTADCRGDRTAMAAAVGAASTYGAAGVPLMKGEPGWPGAGLPASSGTLGLADP